MWRLAAIALACAGAVVLGGASTLQGQRSTEHTQGATASRVSRVHPFVYVAIGASDSYGVGVDDPATQSWPADLARRLPAGTRVVNLGIPGILLNRAVDVELPVALDARPNLVTVWLAVNDLAAGVPLPLYRLDLDTLLGTLQHGTHARVLIANVPNLALLPSFARYPGLDPVIRAWNAVIAGEARVHGATLVDLYGRWRELAKHPEYVGPDGLHPTVEGYQRLADLFWQAYLAGNAPTTASS